MALSSHFPGERAAVPGPQPFLPLGWGFPVPKGCPKPIQSISMLAALVTLPHFSVSSATLSNDLWRCALRRTDAVPITRLPSDDANSNCRACQSLRLS